MFRYHWLLQVAKLVAGPGGRRAVRTVFSSVDSNVPAAVLAFSARNASVTINSLVCVSIFRLYFLQILLLLLLLLVVVVVVVVLPGVPD